MSRPCLALALVLALHSPALAQPAGSQPSLLENLSLFVGPEGSKQPQDLGINANMGIRLAANWGFPLVESLHLGAQVGAAVNVSDAAVHVVDQIEGTSGRTQTFVTFGVFQRPTDRVNWGLAYDQSVVRYFDDFTFGQLRGQAGYQVTTQNEVGVWFTKSVKGDEGIFASTPVHLDPISQVNGYWRRTWPTAAQTSLWVGVASAHHNVVWVFPNDTRDPHVLVYGAEVAMPLSDRFAVTGAANLVTPTSTGTVDAFLGLSFYPGRSAQRAAGNGFAPITGVANNTSMPINLSR